MCGGGGGNPGLDYQKEQERERAQRIEQGMDLISRLFDGDKRGVDAAPEFAPSGTYYDAGGQLVYSPEQAVGAPGPAPARTSYDTGKRGFTGRNNAAYDAWVQKKRAYQQQQQRLNRMAGAGALYTDVERSGGFTPDFYQQRARAYQDYATPQLEDQYADAGQALTYQLARQGALGSSVAAERRADLNQNYQQNLQDIANQGQDYASRAKQAVAEQRSSLVNALQASADPSAISQTATSALDALRDTPKFQPIGDAFEGATAGLGSYLEGRRYGDLQRRSKARYSLGDGNSGRVVRN